MFCDKHLKCLTVCVVLASIVTMINPAGIVLAVSTVAVPLNTDTPPITLYQRAKWAAFCFTFGIFVTHALRELIIVWRLDRVAGDESRVYCTNLPPTFYIIDSILRVSLYTQPLACLSVVYYAHYAQKYWLNQLLSHRFLPQQPRQLRVGVDAVETVASAEPVFGVVEGRRVDDQSLTWSDEIRIFRRTIDRLVELADHDALLLSIGTLALALESSDYALTQPHSTRQSRASVNV